MSVVQHIYDLTIELYQFLSKEPDKEERDGYIETILGLLDKREHLIDELKEKTKYTEEERKLGQQIVGYNQSIDLMLERFFHVIEKDVREVRQQQKLHQKYTNPYQVQGDGMFFDKRK